MGDLKRSALKALVHALEALVILGIAWVALKILPTSPEMTTGIVVGAGSFIIKMFRDFTEKDYVNHL